MKRDKATDSERTKRRYSTVRKRDRREHGWKRRESSTAGGGERGEGEGREKVKREVKEE